MRTSLGLCLLLLLAAPAAAQDAPWRAEVEKLTSRWSDDAGLNRLARARDHLRAYTTTTTTDPEAYLELARCELAADQVQTAQAAAERAAALWLEQETREGAGGADPATPKLAPEIAERRGSALAVAYLAATRAALADARQESTDEQKARAAIEERTAAIEKRRKDLERIVGQDRAAAILGAESRRVQGLRVLDPLGQEPRPLGGDAEGVDFARYRGKVLLVLFWSKDVVDCTETLLACDAVVKELSERGLTALGVCLDPPGGAAAALVAEKGIAWRQVYTGNGLLARDAKAWEVKSLPAGVLVDGSGRVRYLDPWQGDLRQACLELLERRDVAAEAGKRW